MKNGTELPLLALLLVAALAVLFAIWSSMQVDLAAAQVNATVAQGQMPLVETITGQVSGWIVKAVLGVLALGAASALVLWVRSLLQKRPSGQWQGGPNARWQREPRPRAISEAELMRMYLMQQLTGGRPADARQMGIQPAQMTSIYPEGEDEAQIIL